jgi:cation diffusion facilitator family transporter
MELKRLISQKKETDLKDPDVRAKYAYREACVSIIGNSLLFVFKLFLGIFINSIGLITDAFHTLSDTGSSVVIIFGFKAAKKGPDEQHPFGHGRFEHIATIVIAILLCIAGVQFIFESVNRLMDMVEISTGDLTLIIGIVVIVSSVVKELMARYAIMMGRKIESEALLADAWHHRTDALSSVAVGLGIIGVYLGYHILDPIFGIAVSLLIIYTAVRLFRHSSDTLVGSSPDKDTVDLIGDAANSVDGVCGVHKITVHDYGSTKVVSLHVEVECDISAEKAHDIAQAVEDRVTDITNSATIVHIDPDKESRIDSDKMERAIEEILHENKAVLFYHKVKVTSSGDESNIDMHIVVDREMPVSMSHNLTHHIEEILSKRFPNCNVNTHIEPCNGKCETCPGICKKE